MNNIKINSLGDYICCLLLSLALVAAPNYLKNGSCKFSISYLVQSMFIFGCLIIINFLIRKYIIRNVVSPFHLSHNRYKEFWSYLLENKHSFLIFFAIIMTCWLPVICALYPGTLINDTWAQLQQFINYFYVGIHHGIFSNHHPILDTLTMGSVITPFGEKLGNWHWGFFMYTLLQEILTALSFSASVYYSHKYLRIQPVYVLTMLLFYSLCPIFPVSAQTISKDALFSWIYVWFVILFIEAVRTSGKAFMSKRYCILLVVCSVFCILTKSVGLYVVGISLLALCLFIPKVRFRSFLTLACVLVISLGSLHTIESALNVAPSGKQEIFSVPFPQTARYCKYHPKDVSKSDFRSINVLLDGKTIGKKYEPTNADPVKGYTDRGNVKQYVSYMISWFNEGLRHPDTYISAFNAMVSGWFSFREYFPLMSMDMHTQLSSNIIAPSAAQRPPLIDRSSRAMQRLFDGLYNNSITQLIFTFALYASILPLFIVATFLRRWNLKKAKYYWISIVPLVLSIILGCWLAPVSISFEGRRYLYPVIYTIPVMISLCLSLYQQKYSSDRR